MKLCEEYLSRLSTIVYEYFESFPSKDNAEKENNELELGVKAKLEVARQLQQLAEDFCVARRKALLCFHEGRFFTLSQTLEGLTLLLSKC
jgi:hypothetical protein